MVTSAPPENICIKSPLDFTRTLEQLRENILGADMMVLHEIDTQAIIARAGVKSDGLRQLLYFHPRYMKQVLERNPAAVIEAPMKLVVRETSSGVAVYRLNPRATFGRYPGLESLGEELGELASRIAQFKSNEAT